MGDLVSDGTSFMCDKCPGMLKITVISSSADGCETKIATESNFIFLPPGAPCTALGITPPPPCVPPPLMVSKTGQSDIEIDGSKALSIDCELKCPLGGTLSVTSPAQTDAEHGGAESG